MLKVVCTDGGTGPAGILNELLGGHLALLFGVVGVGGEHDYGVGEGEQFVCVIEVVHIGLVESKCELPDDPLYLLCFSWQSELAEEGAHGEIELHALEVEQFAEGVQHQQYLLVVLPKILAEHCLVDAFEFDDVLGHCFRTVFVDEALGDVVGDGELRFLVEHKDEEFAFLGLLFVLADVVQLHYQLAVAVLLLSAHALLLVAVGVAVLLKVGLDLLLELGAALLGLGADHGVAETHARRLLIAVELLQFVLVELYQFGCLRSLHLYLYLFVTVPVPSRLMGVFSEVISSDTDLNNTIV
jgi:hypothetical protein